jgi:hypothetical protein
MVPLYFLGVVLQSALKCPDPRGILLGFAAFDEVSIQRGLKRLASALEQKHITSSVLLPGGRASSKKFN